jgi:predicted nucleic acid-binding protein
VSYLVDTEVLSEARRSFAGADGLIAATARVHNLTLVTRNVVDFGDGGFDVVNPWAA